MKPPLDFYFDFSSPYGYLAATRIDALARCHEREVQWRPILLGAVFKVTGGAPLPSLPLKGSYAQRDMARSARFYGIPFKFPDRFPIAGQVPARAYYWVEERDAALAHEFARALFGAYFVDGRDISDAETTADIAATLGLERGRTLSAITEQRIKARLMIEVDGAIQRGVFGSPYIVADGEPFWGADRFDQLERWLATGPF